MAARKKAKTRSGRKKASVKKPVSRKKALTTRKKAAPARKKVARRKAVARRPAPKSKPSARRAPAPKAMARPAPAAKPAEVSPLSRPSAPTAPGPAPVPGEGEERIGVITHYYSHLSVAVVRLEMGRLRVGDTIHVIGHTTDFRQPVDSLQIEHETVTEVGPGDDFGLKVIEHAREHDVVYKVKA